MDNYFLMIFEGEFELFLSFAGAAKDKIFGAGFKAELELAGAGDIKPKAVFDDMIKNERMGIRFDGVIDIVFFKDRGEGLGKAFEALLEFGRVEKVKGGGMGFG